MHIPGSNTNKKKHLWLAVWGGCIATCILTLFRLSGLTTKHRSVELGYSLTSMRPKYCCVILTNSEPASRAGAGSSSSGEAQPQLIAHSRGESSSIFVEKRGSDAKIAAGKLTCFGGKVEEGESPESCILRECQEEMGWRPSHIKRAVDFYVDDRLVAWFYEAQAPRSTESLQFEVGREGVWLKDFSDPNLSDWHSV
eukprot:CAMPEP_0197526250 /NCGR_PEP_ID=MMETSP1318-20131121/17007_1 /TAXON_ID=552666 /ORGANISM="Partenskyella glossopodia, Strain RCC365" /LENGTH=196 /DNA_ID=CAMNT_0043080333 /DNA_START=71 /DNA_END=657 /DNA_ORIENTATION=+